MLFSIGLCPIRTVFVSNRVCGSALGHKGCFPRMSTSQPRLSRELCCIRYGRSNRCRSSVGWCSREPPSVRLNVCSGIDLASDGERGRTSCHVGCFPRTSISQLKRCERTPFVRMSSTKNDRAPKGSECGSFVRWVFSTVTDTKFEGCRVTSTAWFVPRVGA